MNSIEKDNYYFSQPHQPFFSLAILNAIAMMGIFILGYKGFVHFAVDVRFFHSYSFIYLVFFQAFSGFLFTTFPRFNQSSLISKSFYTNIFFANALASALFIAGAFTSVIGITFSLIINLIAYIYTFRELYFTYKNGKALDKQDSFWILYALGFGLFGNFLFLLSLNYPLILNFAVNVSFYLFLIFLAFSVGQRMVPFFSHSFASKNVSFVKYTLILLVCKVFFATSGTVLIEALIDLLLTFYLLKELLRWNLNPLKSPAILWVLHLAFFWLPVTFLLSSINLLIEYFTDISFYFFTIHLLALGFLTTIFIGFATRVIKGHSGQIPHADKWDIAIFSFIQFIVIVRATFSLSIGFAWNINFLYDIASSTWIILYLVWGLKYYKTLLYGFVSS